MALITCPECGKQISSKAAICVNCGYPIAAMPREDREKIIETIAKGAEETNIQPTDESNSTNDKTDKSEDTDKRQARAIHKLEEKIEGTKFKIYLFRFVGIATIAGLIWGCWSGISVGSSGIIWFSFIGFGALSIPFWYGQSEYSKELKKTKEDMELCQNDFAKYQEKVKERLSDAIVQFAKNAETMAPQLPQCPNCGSRNTKRITTTARALSIGAVGLASSKIGKQYECLNCKHKW